MPTSSKNKQSYHHGNLRQALIDGALNCIRQYGKEKLSLRGLAREVGVSQSAPYRHFSDKNALLSAIVSQGFDTLTQELENKLADTNLEPNQALETTGKAYVEFAVNNPETYRLMFGMRNEDLRNEEMEVESNCCYKILQQIIADGQKAGLFSNIPLEILSLTAWSSVHGYASLVIDGIVDAHNVPDEHPEFGLGRILLNGLLARTPE